jgi:hypothetical protein
VNISRCIPVVLLVASTTTGCSSCAKDDEARPSANVPSSGPSTPLTERRATPLPLGFARNPPGNLTPATVPVVPDASAAVDAGSDATTH